MRRNVKKYLLQILAKIQKKHYEKFESAAIGVKLDSRG